MKSFDAKYDGSGSVVFTCLACGWTMLGIMRVGGVVGHVADLQYHLLTECPGAHPDELAALRPRKEGE